MYRVLTVVEKLNLGGIEKTLLSCVDGLQASNIDLHVLCNRGGALEQKFKDKGVTIHHFGKFKYPMLKAFRMLHIAKKYNIPIAHSRDGHTSGFQVLISKLGGVYSIVSIHNELSMFKVSWSNKAILKPLRKYYLKMHKCIIHKFANLIIGHSKANLKYFNNFKTENNNKYRVLNNGVDFHKLNYNRRIQTLKEPINIIHIGSFKAQKNHEMLIKIYSALKNRGHLLTLTLCGDGKLMNQIKKQSQNLDIRFLGNVDDISPYLNKTDILLFPSNHEGFGNVNIEAQYMGVAICASDISPHYESVYKGYHKYFFSTNNLDEAVINCEQLIYDMSNPSFLEVVNNAKLYAEKFSVEKMAKELATVYQNAIY